MKRHQVSTRHAASTNWIGGVGCVFVMLLFCILCVQAGADPGEPQAKGIYVLSGPGGVAGIDNADRPFVDGFAWRTRWKEFDVGTTGPRYDFSSVSTAISELQTINKKLTLTIFVQEVPSYVLTSAQDRFYTIVPSTGRTTYQVLAPVPWDVAAINHYRNFMYALAEHRVYDAMSGTMVPLRDHPTLAGFRTCVIGTHGLSDPTHTIINLLSYTRDRFVAGVLANLHAVQDAFPSTPTWFEYQSIRDTTRKPTLDSVLLAAVASEFDGVKNPHIGFFIEYLRGDAPGPDTLVGINLLTARANGSPVLFQACGPWCTHAYCKWTPGDDSPENGLDFGYSAYGSVYYEMYDADLEYVSFQPVFEAWHGFLQSLHQ